MKNICKICNKEYDIIGYHALITHHIKPREYYDKFLKQNLDEGYCLYCNKPTKFLSITSGYLKYCNNSCASLNKVSKNGDAKLYDTLYKNKDFYMLFRDCFIYDKVRTEKIIKQQLREDRLKQSATKRFQKQKDKEILREKFRIKNQAIKNDIQKIKNDSNNIKKLIKVEKKVTKQYISILNKIKEFKKICKRIHDTTNIYYQKYFNLFMTDYVNTKKYLNTLIKQRIANDKKEQQYRLNSRIEEYDRLYKNENFYDTYKNMYIKNKVKVRKIIENIKREELILAGKARYIINKHGTKIFQYISNDADSTEKGKRISLKLKGRTKENYKHLQECSKRMHEHNSYHKLTKEQQNNLHKKISVKMKANIASGRFTPKVTNSWANSRVKIKVLDFEKEYRSTWEAVFQILNPTLIYESKRIQYLDPTHNIMRNYIVDFEDKTNKVLYEIKPNALSEDVIVQAKRKYAEEWCKLNDYKYIVIGNEWFKENANKIDYSQYDPKLLKGMKQFLQ